MKESEDSTFRKLIYTVPFTENFLLWEIIANLETNFSEKTFIDIEMNTLEDAYITIAREEDHLLYDLVNKGVRTSSL